jgi:formate dehydrogenase iron-sulfur subunit
VKFIEQFTPDRAEGRWLMMSDVCKHCVRAGCPFGVIDINPVSGTAQKCTLCYDRMRAGMEPACSKACPTDSINFGTIRELRQMAERRVGQLHTAGERRAYLYGTDEKMLGGLNSFYLLVDKPEVYGLPPDPRLPSRNLKPSSLWSALGAVVLGVMGIISFRSRGRDDA